MKKIIIYCVLLLLIIIQVSYPFQNIRINDTVDQKQEQNDRINSKFISSSRSFFSKIYLDHSPISITNNSGFSLYGFLGNGTIDNPYILENLSISNGSISLISIVNTTVHFIIRNSVFDGISGNFSSISLTNVKNAVLTNNSIYKSYNGIFLSISTNISVLNNSIYDNSNDGVRLYKSPNNLIYGNYIYYNTRDGIFIDFGVDNISISFNEIFSNGRIGIRTSGMNFYLKISNNMIYDNIRDGLNIYQSSYCEILNNTIYMNENGYVALQGGRNIIEHNQFINNGFGILFGSFASKNFISNNFFLNNSNYAIKLSSSEFCQFTWNIFINNNYISNDSSQIYDLEQNYLNFGSSSNKFQFNYYSELISSDLNHDGIYDEPYIIDGSDSYDPYSLVSTEKNIENHFLTDLLFLTLVYQEYDGNYKVYWNLVVDSFKYTVNYALYYSKDLGSTWNPIIIDTPYNYYRWNISLLEAGCYQLKVVAKSDGGLTTEVLSEKIPIMMEHNISTSEIIIPNSNNTLSEKVTIQWTPAIDNCFYTVTYNISYSADGGGNWSLLVSGFNNTSFEWDTTSVANGDNYKIKVVAISSGGLISTTIYDKLLTIYNDPLLAFLESIPFIELFFIIFIASELVILSFILNFVKKKNKG